MRGNKLANHLKRCGGRESGRGGEGRGEGGRRRAGLSAAANLTKSFGPYIIAGRVFIIRRTHNYITAGVWLCGEGGAARGTASRQSSDGYRHRLQLLSLWCIVSAAAQSIVQRPASGSIVPDAGLKCDCNPIINAES